MTVPGWVNHASFYQIFPDRFNKGLKNSKGMIYQPWGSIPTIHGFQGGDLEGIRQKLDYLTDSGFNAIYLNPIFESPSTHRYNTTNYLRIDPKLGTIEEFQHLLADAHKKNVKIVLDGVFNHCGRGFFAFNDLLENQKDSLYAEWFHIKHFPIDAYSPGDAKDYLGWWKYKSLPKFNTDNPAVREFIFEVAKYWMDMGIDGWRLDVPNEIDDDIFWGDFRRIVKSANPEAYLIGEIWDINPRWVGDQAFDGLMNYPLRTLIIDLVNGTSSARSFTVKIQKIIDAYPSENLLAMYSLLGSHDTERIFTLVKKDLEKLKLAYLLLFVFPGVPSIYYGDETGLEGGKDPDCRRPFDWNVSNWNEEIRSWITKLLMIRNQNSALQDGLISKIESKDGILHMNRDNENNHVSIWVNPSPTAKNIHIVDGGNNGNLVDLIEGTRYNVDIKDLEITINPFSGLILSRQ